MKKVLLSAVALLIAGVTFGQAKWGIVAGPQFSSVTYKAAALGATSKETSKIQTGLRAGVTVDIPLGDEFYVGTGLLYTGRGGKFKNMDTKANLSYLQLPVNFMFKPEVGSGNLVLAIGPYIAYGLGGKYTDLPLLGERKAFDDEATALYKLKRFDAGGNIQIGYEMPVGLYFGLNADLGMVNAFDNTDNDRKFKNTSFGVSVGYKFGGH
ncbi:outer membrane beta-barrel protein [Chitinophaga qingshengii]|uniref:PorT family protein n=1 Tax=Chitinophaga qingshengii TaxID=1569794 RepID=A0ABR7TVA7_9BACT|nr:outer membrane beta-barrel protein [Chitinophaga qingshengii]MBC9933580.1 PorT family protein [Chitinophaga qingshengii]